MPDPVPDARDALAELQQRCRELGVPLTVQRRAIYGALAARCYHPTADQLFADLDARLPGISKATAYRTLDTLVKLGLVVRVGHPGGVARYDAKTCRHHHLFCDACGAVADLDSRELDRLAVPDLAAHGFAMRDFSVHVRGVCAACRRNGRRSERAAVGADAAAAASPRPTRKNRRKS